MSTFKRFDLIEESPLSQRELRRRWSKFRADIYRAQGDPLRRIVGQVLGVETRREKAVKAVLSPLRKGQVSLAPPSVRTNTPQPQVFPENYQLKEAIASRTSQRDSQVLVLVVPSAPASIQSLIDSLNETVFTTSAKWILLVNEDIDGNETSFIANELIARALPESDVVFGDEAGGSPLTPILKSKSVGPHTLLSYNCVGRPALLRTETIRAHDGFNREAGFAFEHDYYLRLSESGREFTHVPRVFSGGRNERGLSPAIDQDTLWVVSEALKRRGIEAACSIDNFAGLVRWAPKVPLSQPSVDIVIPTRDRIDLVERCIQSIEKISTYRNFNVIILDNDSIEPATLAYFERSTYQVVPCPGPFNYAHIVNRGIQHATADYVVTLNNDTVILTPDWLEQLVGYASLPDVGIVGGCLMDLDESREHESIVIAPFPQHLRTDSNYPHVDAFSLAIKDVAAVTGAVQMVRRDFWQELGGMDEELRVVMNDVDICLRSQLEGKYVLYTPHVKLFHAVSSSRGTLNPSTDRNRFVARWDIFGTFQDPFFPESLQLLGETVYYKNS